MAGPEITGLLPALPPALFPAAFAPPLPAEPALAAPPLFLGGVSFLLQPPAIAAKRLSVATPDHHKDAFMFRFSTGQGGRPTSAEHRRGHGAGYSKLLGELE